MSTPQKSNFGELLAKTILPKVLFISVLVSAIGLVFHFLDLNGKTDILMVGFSSLAGVFFLSAFAVVTVPADSKHSPYALIVFKVLYISSAVLVIGILFSILKMGGYKEMLQIGCGTVGLGVIVAAALVGTNRDNMVILMRPFVMGIPLFLLGVYFLYQLPTT